MARKASSKPDPGFTIGFEAKLWFAVENLHQSHSLSTLRDTLLPKLLSGELSVAEVEMAAIP